MIKKGVVSEYLPWILIAILILVVLFIIIFLLEEEGVSAIDKIKSLFRWGNG